MSYQACDSCDQLLEVGEPGSEVGAPGFWPSPSRKMSVCPPACLSLADSIAPAFSLCVHLFLLPQMFYPLCTYSLETGNHCTDTQTFYNISDKGKDPPFMTPPSTSAVDKVLCDNEEEPGFC